ncbi:DUF1934 domain-containing protein [Companilactobacillus sp. DQM5]|uniref:DUF1934 domain-containing protein n=1 Tax=Companilactobacillus sp. DQM5 TaxID=3463359 RepID=UPI00405855C1
MNNSKQIKVKLETLIKQDENIDSFTIESEGTIESFKDRHVIQFLEENSENIFNIRFDLMKTGEVLLNRQSKNRQEMSDFYFKEQDQKDVIYKTIYGTMNLIAKTLKININLDEKSEKGEIKIQYNLYNQDQILGEYKLRLIFRG